MDIEQNAASFFIDRHAYARADRIAILHAHGQVTYAELARAVNQAGNYLQHLGVRPEQRVVLHLHDGPEFIYFFMAALKIGAVAVPVNTFCDAALLAFYLNDARAPVLVTHHQYANKTPAAAGHLAPSLRYVAYVDEERWNAESAVLDAFPVAGDDSAFWLYTSGSTGTQKGVVHRHAGMQICAQGYARDVLEIDATDRCYSASKSFFAYGLGNSVMFPLAAGATCVLNAKRSDAETVVQCIRQFRPTLFFAVPALYHQLLAAAAVDRKLFAGVRMCVSAGEYLPETVFHHWRERTGQTLYDGIGSTEAMHIFCSNRPQACKPGTSGKPVDGYELKIVDASGARVAATEIGRLLVRGKTIAKGYWNRYDANQSAFQGEWLATGDIYQETEDGYYRYVGRQDDVFKSSGLWVSPGEVEQALLSCPGVREAAVVAVRGKAGLTVAKAYIVLHAPADSSDHERTREEIHRHLSGKLSRYKIPTYFEFLPSLPKTATGKIARGELRLMHRDAPAAAIPSADAALETSLPNL